jgi:hypothetical protein
LRRPHVAAAASTPVGPEYRQHRPVPAQHPAGAASSDLATQMRPPTWSEWMFWLPMGVMTTMAIHAALRTL